MTLRHIQGETDLNANPPLPSHTAFRPHWLLCLSGIHMGSSSRFMHGWLLYFSNLSSLFSPLYQLVSPYLSLLYAPPQPLYIFLVPHLFILFFCIILHAHEERHFPSVAGFYVCLGSIKYLLSGVFEIKSILQFLAYLYNTHSMNE